MSDSDASPDLPKFEFLAGRLSLDFCNSLTAATGKDRLRDGAALAGWAERAGYRLDARAGSVELDQFHELRRCLHDMFTAAIAGQAPRQADLDILSRSASARPDLRWDMTVGHAVSRFHGAAHDRLRHEIACDAIDLVTGGRLGRVRRCANHTCQWFFFDSSRNGKRRWCAMADCGTRAKVRRYRDHHAPLRA